MTRSLFIFFGTFLAGALIALVGRASLFQPHATHEGPPQGGGEYSAMVSNPLVPASKPETGPLPSAPPATRSPMEGSVPSIPGDERQKSGAGGSALPLMPSAETSSGAKPSTAALGTVNTVCAICGMEVDPKIPTVEYRGKTIGFGCRMCPPKFKADPDRYGPLYLKNEVIER